MSSPLPLQTERRLYSPSYVPIPSHGLLLSYCSQYIIACTAVVILNTGSLLLALLWSFSSFSFIIPSLLLLVTVYASLCLPLLYSQLSLQGSGVEASLSSSISSRCLTNSFREGARGRIRPSTLPPPTRAGLPCHPTCPLVSVLLAK